MAFPPSFYTQRGGVGSVERWEAVAPFIEPQDEGEPEEGAADATDTSDEEGIASEDEPVQQAA
jgi:ParB family chromosome partitioning protein